MVDVSDLSAVSSSAESPESETEVIPIGIGPLPSVPTLTTEELKLYGVLSRGDGLILSEDKEALIGDICWQEVILDQGDTIASIAEEYGIKAEDIRRANGLKPNENPKYTDILYIPDRTDSVPLTLAYVNKLKKYEQSEKRQATFMTVYVVKMEIPLVVAVNLNWILIQYRSNNLYINYSNLGSAQEPTGRDIH